MVISQKFMAFYYAFFHGNLFYNIWKQIDSHHLVNVELLGDIVSDKVPMFFVLTTIWLNILGWVEYFIEHIHEVLWTTY